MKQQYFKDIDFNVYQIKSCKGWYISAENIEDVKTLVEKRSGVKPNDDEIELIGNCTTIFGKSDKYEDVINMREKLNDL